MLSPDRARNTISPVLPVECTDIPARGSFVLVQAGMSSGFVYAGLHSDTISRGGRCIAAGSGMTMGEALRSLADEIDLLESGVEGDHAA